MERTQGSETSQYLKEEKSIEILLVAASERGIAQTVQFTVRGCGTNRIGSRMDSRTTLESGTVEGDSPVDEILKTPDWHPSRSAHVKR
jgi:hypothetical protein